jgi:hypothetical protein
MKLNAKLQRIDIKEKSNYRTNYIYKRDKLEGDRVHEDEMSDYESANEYRKLIYPWIQKWSKKWSKYFFYNPKTKTSKWELPKGIALKAERFFDKKIKRDHL